MNNDRKFVIRAIPDKGLGVIATDPIDEGEVIISEAPLFTQALARNADTIAASLAQKSTDEKRQYLSLANCHKTNRFNPLHGIFETNALPCGDNMPSLGTIASKAGIFLQCSRFNSSCTPNVHNWWNEEAGVLVMRALKPIAQGEELCICYCNEWRPRSIRQKAFKAKFGFTCTCANCSLDGESLINSDHRRTQLGFLYDEIEKCASDPVLGVKKVKLALNLLREEGLVHGEHQLAYDAFQFCAACANLQLAKAWAKKAQNAAFRMSGNGSEDTLKYAKYARNPKSHPAWGWNRQKADGLEGPDA